MQGDSGVMDAAAQGRVGCLGKGRLPRHTPGKAQQRPRPRAAGTASDAKRARACRMSVPMVMAPCGVLVDLVSDRHLITMDVEDMDTWPPRQRAHSATSRFTQQAGDQGACTGAGAAHSAPCATGRQGRQQRRRAAGRTAARACACQARALRHDRARAGAPAHRGAQPGGRHQRAHEDALVHGGADEVRDQPRDDDEQEDLDHAACAQTMRPLEPA